jgi:hypothetical protein
VSKEMKKLLLILLFPLITIKASGAVIMKVNYGNGYITQPYKEIVCKSWQELPEHVEFWDEVNVLQMHPKHELWDVRINGKLLRELR